MQVYPLITSQQKAVSLHHSIHRPKIDNSGMLAVNYTHKSGQAAFNVLIAKLMFPHPLQEQH